MLSSARFFVASSTAGIFRMCIHPSSAFSGVRSSCDSVARKSSFSRFGFLRVSIQDGVVERERRPGRDVAGQREIVLLVAGGRRTTRSGRVPASCRGFAAEPS